MSASLLALSCVMDKIDTQITDEEAIANIRLECDALESYTIQAENPQAVSFSVSSTTPWEITGVPDWLTVSPLSSSVSSLAEDIVVKASANAGFTDRSATLTIKGKNTEIAPKVVITQLRKGKLQVTPISGEFEKSAGSKTFDIESNVSWSASVDDDWLSLSDYEGDGNKTVTASATQNKALIRTTTVRVESGDLKYNFEVVQKGERLEFINVASTEIAAAGGELVLSVSATLDWNVSCDNAVFTVSKVGTDQVKISAPGNNKFIERGAKVILSPSASGFDGVSNSLDITQGVMFTFDGNYEILSDGSVKLSSGAKSRVITAEKYRYARLVITMGDVNFGDKGEMWCSVAANGCNIYNQLSLGGNLRIRTDGTLPNAGTSTYKNTTYSITKDELNAMTEYRFDVLPNTATPANHYLRFYYNGTMKAEQDFLSIFADDPTAEGNYWFGFYNTTTDGTWYIVKSCDITPIAE